MRLDATRYLASLTALAALLLPGARAARAQQSASSLEIAADPILRAMQAELDRSKTKLKMDNIAAPYYIEYRVTDVDQFQASAEYGALRDQARVHLRLFHVVVRIGDYKQDSYFGAGQGEPDFLSIDNEEMALRHQMWLATDAAYKRAGEALAAKLSMLKQLNVEEPVDDFARARPTVAIEPLVNLSFDPATWIGTLESITSVYRSDPDIQSMGASLNFAAVNQYFINTEGTVTRHGETQYSLSFDASEQAADGMRLDRSPVYTAARIEDLPAAQKIQADAAHLVEIMKQLRAAPIVDEEYRGPVLFSSDAADDMFSDLIAVNVVGRRPQPGRPARTTGAFATSFKSRVLPDFFSVVDDPTQPTFDKQGLSGYYRVDDEGVPAAAVTVVDKGELVNFLVGRQPIRDFPASNGHGRASGSGVAMPALGNLFIRASKTRERADLIKQMLDICRERGLDYGYFVDTLGPRLTPRVLYRVWAKDGREEMVRGAVFNELDTRALRNDLIAAGDDPLVSNRIGVPFSAIISPSVLFDELEVKRADASREKLPEYPAPPLATKK